MSNLKGVIVMKSVEYRVYVVDVRLELVRSDCAALITTYESDEEFNYIGDCFIVSGEFDTIFDGEFPEAFLSTKTDRHTFK